MTVLAPSVPVTRAQTLYAGFWVRVVAFLLDSVAIGLLVGFATAGRPLPVIGDTWSAYANWHNFMETLIGLVYFTIMWSSITGGQTLGMRVLGLRVVGRDMAPIGLGTALLRWVGIVISAAVLLLGLIWVAFDSRKQGWHDKIAGTFVVRANERVGEG